jgi:hypothetical protein
MMNAAAIIFLCLFLISCSTRPPAPPPPERRATLPPHTITIRTSPPGGIVDWNGDVLGAAPVQITFVPAYTYRPRWPDNGHLVEIFRARWPNGDAAAETFISSSTPPSEIGIVSPSRIPDIDLGWGKPSPKRYPNKLLPAANVPALNKRTGP